MQEEVLFRHLPPTIPTPHIATTIPVRTLGFLQKVNNLSSSSYKVGDRASRVLIRARVVADDTLLPVHGRNFEDVPDKVLL